MPIETTAEHPFWVQGEGWTAAEDLEGGEILATLTGDTPLRHIVRLEEAATVYNLSVAQTPNYFVGTMGLWVHNATIVCHPGNVQADQAELEARAREEGIDLEKNSIHRVIPGALLNDPASDLGGLRNRTVFVQLNRGALEEGRRCPFARAG